VRLALAGTDWPNAWPPPGRAEIEVADVTLVLPVLDSPPPVTDPPALAHVASPERAVDPDVVWRYEHDVLARRSAAVTRYGDRYEGHYGAKVVESYDGRVEVQVDDPAHASATGLVRYEIEWPEGRCETESTLSVTSDAEAYQVELALVTRLDGEPFATRNWSERIPRLLN
jgi:hypothetical protein